MSEFFVTVTRNGRNPITLMREAPNAAMLQSALVTEFGEGVSFQMSERCEPPPRHVADWEAEGRRIALEGMDLPDGAYFAMAEELGLEP
jgi:hypothetical protein